MTEVITSSSFLAIDWGTTNRRLYVINSGQAKFVERDNIGALALTVADFPKEVERLKAAFGNIPMLLAGMVGSNRGWIDAGYVPVPAELASLAHAAVSPMPNVEVLPGLSLIRGDRYDVMRGEEVQFFGAVTAGLVPTECQLCQPGTHSKWAQMANGAIVDFTTAMTGEMFAVLKDHSLIGHDMQGEVSVNSAFNEGVDEAISDDLLAALFGARSATLLGRRSSADTASFVSGLLIGSDVRAHARSEEDVYVLSDPSLGPLYCHAINRLGGRAVLVDSATAFVAGMAALQEIKR
jgi:2-dehydro-3-deoxygalactonokinase